MNYDNFKKDIEKFSEDDALIKELSSIFKALSDPTRLKIIYSLSKTELCVGDIVDVLGMSQSSISHQLATLRAKNLIKVKRISRNAIYSLDDEHVLKLFEYGYEHAKHKIKDIENKKSSKTNNIV